MSVFQRSSFGNCLNQLSHGDGLAQTSNATGLESLSPHALVFDGCHKNNRTTAPQRLQPMMQFNTRHAAEMDIQYEAIELRCDTSRQKILGGTKRLGRETMRIKQGFGRPEHARIVFHDAYRYAWL